MWPLVLAGVENFVIITGTLSLASFAVAAIARPIAHRRAWHPLTQSRVYAVALVAPPLVSSWLVVASLLPALWLGVDRWAQEHQALHTLHLFNAWTVSVDPILGYAALLFAMVAALLATYAAVSAYFRIGRVIRRLEIEAEPAPPERVRQVENVCRKYGFDVGLVVSRYPFSFVWGYLRSKLVLSTGLLNALSPEELSALLEHEAAHHARRDNISKWILTACRYGSPLFPLTNLLYRWWSEQVEIVCDEVAARRTNSPVDVAGALVRIKRLSLAAAPRKAQTAESGFFTERSDAFEQRVTRILSLDDHIESKAVTALSRSWGKTAAFVTSAFVFTLVVLFLLSPLAAHRLFETLLH
ncbi:MAG TPA: M56 family metallopeptidase [Blastocatellia bacterium]|nr:M56 family metallopeptidase [Blastocatellia bacterium]